MTPTECIGLEHPSCLFVTPDRGTNRIFFRLPFYPKQILDLALNKPGRIFTVYRPANESFCSFETRLLESMNNYFGRSSKSLKGSHSSLSLQVTKIALSNSQWKPTDTLGTIFSSSEPLQILLDIEADAPKTLALNVKLNPAALEILRLEMIPFIGCPISPAVVGENLDFSKSKFQWFVSKNAVDSEKEAIWPNEEGEEAAVVHEGYTFTPRSEHLGHWVRLRVLPYDSEGRPGQPFGNPVLPAILNNNDGTSAIPRPLPFISQFVTVSQPIGEAPPQHLINQRIAEVTGRKKSPNEFRLICYNLLAGMYSRRETARKIFFPHCPPPYLDCNYRYPLIHRELIAYQADILCLQEVDATHFHQRLCHLLREAGDYEGCFLSKVSIRASPEMETLTDVQSIDRNVFKGEGIAIFYRRSRFRLIKEIKLDSLIIHAETSTDPWFMDIASKYHRLAESKEVDLYLCMRARAHGALICLFECANTGRRFLCANTHLYFEPKAVCLRNLQCLILRKYLLKLAEELADGEPLPIVLAADLNTTPDSQPYQLLVAGPINNDGTLQEPELILKAAVPLPEGVFTNMVPTFKANLDAILYGTPKESVERLEVAHAFSVPSESAVIAEGRNANPKYPPILPEEGGGFALPNSLFPSDHLPLIADFTLR
ncbi:hypothetical protein Aperf_G00000130319 [Anoplocephala perfoliata]